VQALRNIFNPQTLNRKKILARTPTSPVNQNNLLEILEWFFASSFANACVGVRANICSSQNNLSEF